jgi:transcriptional regulator with XRE-family HTH domain
MRLSIGTRLKELRQNKNLRQDQLAELIGVSKSTVSSYENEGRQPSYDILVSLARVFRVSTDYLLGLTDSKNIDVSGLTEHEVNVICELVSMMAEKNERLNE